MDDQWWIDIDIVSRALTELGFDQKYTSVIDKIKGNAYKPLNCMKAFNRHAQFFKKEMDFQQRFFCHPASIPQFLT